MGRMKVGAVGLLVAGTIALASCSSSSGSDGAAAESTPTTTAPDAAGAAGAADAITTGATPPPGVPLLGVLSATGGTYDDGTLTLTGVIPAGTWFTDRPVRRAGTTAIDDFTPLFFDRNDPPNAAVEIAGADEGADVAIAELSDPAWDADARTLTFTAKLIPDHRVEVAKGHPGLANHIARNDSALPASFGAATLFIDAGMDHQTNTPVQNQVTDVTIQGLQSELASIIAEWDQMTSQLLQAYMESRTPCTEGNLESGRSILDDLMVNSTAQLKELLADANANEGIMPNSDWSLYWSNVGALDGAKGTYQMFQGNLDAVLDGSLCFG